MVRTVIAYENQLKDLVSSSVKDAFIPGLILGQCSEDKDYVAHFASTPYPKEIVSNEAQPSGDSDPASGRILKKITDIEDKWFSAHAKNLSRMLPGGMWIIGLYVVGPGDVFSNNTALNKIRSVITQVHKCCKSNEYLYGCNPNNCLYVFNLCSISKKYSCKSFEVENHSSSLKPVNWKFCAEPMLWLQADCHYNMKTLAPYYLTEERKNYPFKKKMKEILVLLSEKVQKAVSSINDQFVDKAVSLEEIRAKSIERKRQSSSRKENETNIEEKFDVFKINLYFIQERFNDDERPKVEIFRSYGSVEFNGRLSSRVFMHSNATAGETTKAIKEDIIRSWSSRLEMHWDSYDETQNKKNAGKTNHLLPRRVLCPLPHNNVCLSEYVFPDEDLVDVISSFEEQLGISVDLNSLDGSIERPYDPDNPEETNQESQAGTGTQKRVRSKGISMLFTVGIVVASIVLLLSILIQINSSS